MLLDKRIPYRYLLGQVKYDMIRVFIISATTFALKAYYNEIVPVIPIALPAFLGTAISLLLSFKLSQSYDRWWEARKIWGAIVNDSRNLTMQVMRYCSKTANAGDNNLARRISYRQIAWAYCLGQTLRNQDSLRTTEKFIDKGDLDYLNNHDNKPLALIDLHYSDLAAMHQKDEINDFQQVQIGETLGKLCDSMGQAERIKNTVFPTTYRQILHLFIYIFLIIMSISLLEINSIWEIPIDLLIALPFFMIEKTSTYMQDPFMNQPTDTSVTAIATTIEKNIKQLWSDTDVPNTAIEEDWFYIL